MHTEKRVGPVARQFRTHDTILASKATARSRLQFTVAFRIFTAMTGTDTLALLARRFVHLDEITEVHRGSPGFAG